MATLSPFWDSEWRLHRHFARDWPVYSLAVWQPKLSAPSNQFGKLRPVEAIYRKNEYNAPARWSVDARIRYFGS